MGFAIFLKVIFNMKSLSVEEKRDLDRCVFQTLGKEEPKSFKVFLQSLLLKIKKIFHSKG